MPQYKKYKNWKGLRIKVRRYGFRRILWWAPFYTGDKGSFYLNIKKIDKSAPDLGTFSIYEKLPEQNKETRVETLALYKGKEEANVPIHTHELTKQGEFFCKMFSPNIGSAIGANLLVATVFSKDKRDRDLRTWILTPFVSIIVTLVVAVLATGIAPNSWIGRKFYTSTPTETPIQVTITSTPTAEQLVVDTITNFNNLINDGQALIAYDTLFTDNYRDRNKQIDFVSYWGTLVDRIRFNIKISPQINYPKGISETTIDFFVYYDRKTSEPDDFTWKICHYEIDDIWLIDDLDKKESCWK